MVVGYTLSDLVGHLESQFVPGMSWDNYGLHGWHIDHIRPVSSFDLTEDDQVVECWALSNLRPLWAADNWSKGARYQKEES